MILPICLLHYHRQKNKSIGADFDTSFERGLMGHTSHLINEQKASIENTMRAAYLNAEINSLRDRLKIIIGTADTPEKRKLALIQAKAINERAQFAALELSELINV
jgi:hypothetical protein